MNHRPTPTLHRPSAGKPERCGLAGKAPPKTHPDLSKHQPKVQRGKSSMFKWRGFDSRSEEWPGYAGPVRRRRELGIPDPDEEPAA